MEKPTDDDLRAEWHKAGGSIHGPRVETVSMPEERYFAFRRMLGNLKHPDTLTLDANEVHFLATRLRRLCNHFGYATPDMDDKFIIGVGGSLIGGLLTKLGVAEKQIAEGDDDFSLDQWWYQSLLEATRRIGTKTEEDRNITRAVVGVVPRLVSLYAAQRLHPLSEHSETDYDQLQRDIDEAYPHHERTSCDDQNLYNAPTLLLTSRCARCQALDQLRALKQKGALADAGETLLKISRMGIPAGEAAAAARDALARINALLGDRHG